MRTRQPLPDNDNALARIAGISLDSWSHAFAIVKPNFRLADGKLNHDFCDHLLAEQDELTRQKSVIGKIGAQKRWKKTEQNQSADSTSHASATPPVIAEERRGG